MLFCIKLKQKEKHKIPLKLNINKTDIKIEISFKTNYKTIEVKQVPIRQKNQNELNDIKFYTAFVKRCLSLN